MLASKEATVAQGEDEEATSKNDSSDEDYVLSTLLSDDDGDEDDKEQDHGHRQRILSDDTAWADVIDEVETALQKQEQARAIKDRYDDGKDAQDT